MNLPRFNKPKPPIGLVLLHSHRRSGHLSTLWERVKYWSMYLIFLARWILWKWRPRKLCGYGGYIEINGEKIEITHWEVKEKK